MTRVDFYLLQTDSEQKLLDTVCLLIEKARTAEQSVYIHTRSAAHADQLDAALWQYRSVSFIPHLNLGSCSEPKGLSNTASSDTALSTAMPGKIEDQPSGYTGIPAGNSQLSTPELLGLSASNDAESRVAIGYCHEPAGRRDVLINLCETVPPFFSRFRRTLEVVNGSENELIVSRERYRFYKSRGYPLNHHNLS